MKSLTGAIFTLGMDPVIANSTKQKTNTHSSSKSELNKVDNKISMVIWTKFILRVPKIQNQTKHNLNKTFLIEQIEKAEKKIDKKIRYVHFHSHEFDLSKIKEPGLHPLLIWSK